MNLERLPSGRWRVTVQHAGRRLRAVCDTEAEAKLRGAELRIDLGLVPSSTTTTVAELLAAHVAGARLAPHTRDDYRSIVAKLAEVDPRPLLLDARVRDVTPASIVALQQQLERAGWTAHRVQRLHTVLGGAFTTALRLGWVRSHPTRGVAPTSPEPADINPPTADEVRAIIAEATGALRLAIRLAATTGARRGELLALQWGDIDLAGKSLRIRRALTDESGVGIVVKDTKTNRKGHRTVSIGPTVVKGLRTQHAEQRRAALANGLPAPVWVFSDDAGVNPRRPDALTHEYGALVAGLGIETRFHDLRHYVATTLLTGGTPPAIVAGMLGHASVATTLRTYAHFLPGSDGGAAAAMDRQLG